MYSAAYFTAKTLRSYGLRQRATKAGRADFTAKSLGFGALVTLHTDAALKVVKDNLIEITSALMEHDITVRLNESGSVKFLDVR